jgi:hypothetical protein
MADRAATAQHRVSADLTVTPALRTASGAETALPPVAIRPGEVVSLDLSEVLMKAAPALIGAYGSVVLRYSSLGQRVLYAAAMVRMVGQPIAYHLDGSFRSDESAAGSRGGIWWLPRDSVKDYLILSNYGNEKLDTSLALYSASGNTWREPISLAAGQTLRLSVRSFLQQAGWSGEYGGIKLEMAKNAARLGSAHVLFDERGGFSALMKMFGYDPTASLHSRSFGGVKEWTTRAPMLALSSPDPALGFPARTYNHGTEHYRVEQPLAPDEQMLIDFGKLIHNQIADSDGHTLSLDLMQGTYRVKDLTDPALGNLYEGKVIVDKTYGHAAYGCAECCGFSTPYMLYDPLGVPVSSNATQTVQAPLSCDPSLIYDITSSMTAWGTSNSAIATVHPAAQVNGISVGKTPHYADGELYAGDGHAIDGKCPQQEYVPGAGTNVAPTVSISCQLTDMAVGTFAGTATCFTSNVTPSGGTFTWKTNNTTTISLTCTTSGCGNSDNYSAVAASTTQGDTTITVTYVVNGQPATATSKAITVHKPTSLKTISTLPNFATVTCGLLCLANPNSGTCAVKAGTSCSYGEPITQRNYSVLDQFGNTFESVNLGAAPVITETVNAQQGTCGGNGVETGSTSGSPFYDEFGKCDSCCESGGPGCTSTASQTLFSNSINVRQEAIAVTCTSATLTP